jgi:hypothetical protein
VVKCKRAGFSSIKEQTLFLFSQIAANSSWVLSHRDHALAQQLWQLGDIRRNPPRFERISP